MQEPLFQKIKKYVLLQIENKTYKQGDKIPTEFELAKKFSTSRQTVNKALRDLARDGVVERFARSGTFVKGVSQDSTTTILDLKDIAHEVQSRGNIYTNVIISLKEVKVHEKLANILNIVKDQKVYVSEIIHKENDIPIRYDIRYVRCDVVPEYLQQDFTSITPHEYLQRYNPAYKTENTIQASTVDKKIQNYLQIPKNEPCLVISRTVYSKKHAGGYSKLYYPGSRYKLSSIFYN